MDLTVNSVARTVQSPPLASLLTVLREELDITSPKAGCETGGCGACTVLIDGEPRRSCLVAVCTVDGAEVTTVEGLAQNGELHPVQEGFWERHGLQCGFCPPGMIMSAVTLLEENPEPSEEEIRRGIEGNLCRCTGYHNIVQAIEYAGARMRGEEPAPAEWENA